MGRIHDALGRRLREAELREPTPSASSIDSQSVKTAWTSGPAGYDKGKNVYGRKRHVLVDTLGLILAVLVTAADVTDARAALKLLEQVDRERFPRLEVMWTDTAYTREGLPEWVRSQRGYRLEAVRRPEGVRGFVLVPKRWVAERTFAWVGRYRRHARDYERNPRSREVKTRISMIHRMASRLWSKRLDLGFDRQEPAFKYRKAK